MTAPILLDTCALIWWTLDPSQLSPAGTAACQRIPSDGGLISSISIWEIGLKVKKGKIDLGTTIEDYTQRLKRTQGLSILPVDEIVWMKNLELNWTHADPADRTIVATAILSGVSIVTIDKAIRDFCPKSIW